MSNGLGAGFFALTLLVMLVGLAVLALLVTVASTIFHRRRGQVPALLRYLLVGIGIGAFSIAGFGILVLFDEAPAATWVFTSLVVAPLLVVGVYFARTSGLSRFEVLVATVMAWGVLFLFGVAVVLGVARGAELVFDLAPAESQELGVPWIAATVGGIVLVLGMLPLGSRLSRVLP